MNSLSHLAIRTLVMAALTGAAGAASAQTADAPQQPHRGPPPESLAACKTLGSGETCSFTSPRGTVQGTCWAPEGKPLACRPKNAASPGAAGPDGRPGS